MNVTYECLHYFVESAPERAELLERLAKQAHPRGIPWIVRRRRRKTVERLRGIIEAYICSFCQRAWLKRGVYPSVYPEWMIAKLKEYGEIDDKKALDMAWPCVRTVADRGQFLRMCHRMARDVEYLHDVPGNSHGRLCWCRPN